MFQSPSSTSSILTRGSNESKKRKSFTNIPDDQSTASSTESRRTNASLAIERNTASPVTSEGSITTRFVINNESLSPNKDIPCAKEVLIAAALEQPDSDVATEDGSNTTKEAMSSVLGSPTVRLDDTIPRNDSGSNKKPRFSEDVHSPILSRQRSYTFSTAHEYNKQSSLPKSAFDPLAWLASIAERENEVDAAKSLFSLSHDASQDLVEGEEVDEDEEDDQENEVFGEAEGGNDDEDETQYVDPYLTNHNSMSGHSRSMNNMGLNESEFSAISYLQSFQEKAKQWKSNPFDGNSSGKVLDPLELLTTSADLVASPMSKRTLNLSASFKEGLKEMSLLPFPNSTRFNQNSSSNNNGLINFSDSNEVHYLDTMNIDLQNISHTSKVTGRARSASMSLIEGYSSLSNSNQFDNPALARIKESFGKKQGIPIPPKGEGYIGIYSPEERKIRIQRFLEKRKHRMWAKKVKYDVRKNFADSRIRVKGRFVKKEEEKAAMILMQNK
eukprot:gene9432-10243_t